MRAGGQPDGLLEYEARALLARLDQVKPFALHETMVLAAALPTGRSGVSSSSCTAAVAASAHASTSISGGSQDQAVRPIPRCNSAGSS